METDVAVISLICGRIKPFCVMSTALFWCAYTARGILEYLPITRSWFAAELSRCLDKMADVNSVDLIKNALFMPRLAICSRNLHWHWINWTLLCDTMEVSMLRLAWLTTAQHVFQPALTGRLELVTIIATEISFWRWRAEGPISPLQSQPTKTSYRNGRF